MITETSSIRQKANTVKIVASVETSQGSSF